MNVPDPRVGTVLGGRYKVLERMSEGSMGIVYRGERLALQRAIAIKFLNEGYAATDDGRRRFEVEARAMSRLDHPNCVPVTDFGVDEGAPYLVMDFVSGITLRQLLVTEWRVAPVRAVAIVRQILAGLAHAHAQGIIHRDIKPENILVTTAEGHGEHIRIVDFGLAKLRDEGSFTTGVAIGTPGYMSPEQTIGQKADERADVYAAGIILYELLSGAKPFQADNPFETMRMHREVPPAPLSTAAAGVPISSRLDAVVMKALTKSRDDRFSSASAFLEALERVPEARGIVEGSGALRKRGTVIAIGAGVIFAIGGVAAIVRAVGDHGASGPASGGAGSTAAMPAAGSAPAPPPSPPPPSSPTDAATAAAAPPDAAPIADIDGGDAVVAAGAGDAGDGGPTMEGADGEIAKLRELAADGGDIRGAIAALEKLRTERPADPAVHYALANLYAETQAWTQSVQSYAATLRLDPQYQRDDRLIGDVVEALGSKDGHRLAEALIEHDLHDTAKARLREATRSTNRGLRSRAQRVLARLH